MTGTLQSKSTAQLLGSVYKNVKMAGNLILNLMPKVKNEDLRSDMTVQLSAFEAFASRAAKLLGEENEKPADEGTIAKLSAKWDAMVNTVMDSSTSHLAQMMIEGVTVGASELTRKLREAENTGVSESALRLTRDVCAFEEKIIQEMKAYL